MLRILEDDGRGTTPLAAGLGGILLEDPITPGGGDPGGQLSVLEVTVPGVREVRLGHDQLLVNQILPVVSHLQGLRIIDGDLPGLATDAEQVPPILPDKPDELSWLYGWEVGDVDTRVGGMQFGGVVGVLGPGSGDREIILLEDVLPVVELHRTNILRDGVDPITEEDLTPHPVRKDILH